MAAWRVRENLKGAARRREDQGTTAISLEWAISAAWIGAQRRVREVET